MAMRKGLNEFIGVAMIILLTVGVSAIISVWVFDLSKDQTSSVRNQTQQNLACSYANIYIDSARYNCSNNCAAGVNHTINLTIRNTGQIRIEFDEVHIQNTTGVIFTYNFNETKKLNTGGLESFIATSNTSCTGVNNSIYRIRIVSKNCPNDAYDTFDGNDVTFLSC